MGYPVVQYRGSLKSCNYGCSYCPFAKKTSAEPELLQDREQLKRFTDSLAGGKRRAAAVQIVPYGEALIHPWYWEAFGVLSRLEAIQAAGAQTNLSFPVLECLRVFDDNGGMREKLRLWCTFHPEMVSARQFASQCTVLTEQGISYCVGAVGIPENLNRIRELKRLLPSGVYLWINRMDGMKRKYTEEEREVFLSLDPWFDQEIRWKQSDPSLCRNRLFVEADGSMRLCNIGPELLDNWYEEEKRTEEVPCGRKRCSCYLAYGGRQDQIQAMSFGRFPLFRIPWKPKAFFFDIDGTLIPEGRGGGVSEESLRALVNLHKQCPLFLATSLPYEEAMRRCNGLKGLFSGGIFAGGAHLRIKEGKKARETVYGLPLPEEGCSVWEEAAASIGARLLIYERDGIIYKLTMVNRGKQEWNRADVEKLKPYLEWDSCRLWAEGSCIQITAKQADKASGVDRICNWLGIDSREAAAAGNSQEDIPMFRVCGFGIAMPGSQANVCREADCILPVSEIRI